MKMMLPDVIGHENQSQHDQHHRRLCLDLSGRITCPTGFHTTPAPFFTKNPCKRLICIFYFYRPTANELNKKKCSTLTGNVENRKTRSKTRSETSSIIVGNG